MGVFACVCLALVAWKGKKEPWASQPLQRSIAFGTPFRSTTDGLLQLVRPPGSARQQWGILSLLLKRAQFALG